MSNHTQLDGRIAVERKTGTERFRCIPPDLGFSLLNFWQWSASDLVGNTNRGRLAEFIVARALGLGVNDVQNEWEGYDLLFDRLKIEVKSSAYIQSWPQRKLCNPCFSIAPRRSWIKARGNSEWRGSVIRMCMSSHFWPTGRSRRSIPSMRRSGNSMSCQRRN